MIDIDIRHPKEVNESEINGHIRVVFRGRRADDPRLLPTHAEVHRETHCEFDIVHF